jgi:hypothetical protein
MARGFDSKSVEEQQSMALAEKAKKPKETLSPEQQAAKRQRANLELQKKKLQGDLASATNERHKAMIEAALKDVEAKISN